MVTNMPAHRKSLGKVFLSHSSVDKPFVRRLKSRLRREGFETWLDEKDMLVGDALPRQVSGAVGRARAVVIVISKASLQSRWVRSEITQAAHRMIAGNCRLVPVLIEDVTPPDELTGLLYADCRPGQRNGMKRIVEALDAEARRVDALQATLESPDSLTRMRGIGQLIASVFGSTGFASMEVSATRSIDWDTAFLDVDGTEAEVVVEEIIHYGYRDEELTEDDWDDWKTRVLDEINNRLGLLVSERAPSQSLRDRLTELGDAVLGEPLAPGLFEGSGLLVLVSLAGGVTDELARSRIESAYAALVRAARNRGSPLIPPTASGEARKPV